MLRDRFFRWCQRLLLLVALAPVAANSGSQSADSSVLIRERLMRFILGALRICRF